MAGQTRPRRPIKPLEDALATSPASSRKRGAAESRSGSPSRLGTSPAASTRRATRAALRSDSNANNTGSSASSQASQSVASNNSRRGSLEEGVIKVGGNDIDSERPAKLARLSPSTADDGADLTRSLRLRRFSTQNQPTASTKSGRSAASARRRSSSGSKATNSEEAEHDGDNDEDDEDEEEEDDEDDNEAEDGNFVASASALRAQQSTASSTRGTRATAVTNDAAVPSAAGRRRSLTNGAAKASSRKTSTKKKAATADGAGGGGGESNDVNGASGNVKKLPGRRRAPHADINVEVDLRRQLELRVAFRAVVKALKPVLIELADRQIKSFKEDPEAHKRAAEYDDVQANLNQKLIERKNLLDTQLSLNETYMATLKDGDEKAIHDQFRRNVSYAREKYLARLKHKMLSIVREAQEMEDSDATEDEYDHVVRPTFGIQYRKRSTRVPLAESYQSRSRFQMEVDKAVKDIENRIQFRDAQMEFDAESLNTRPKGFAVYDGAQRAAAQAAFNLCTLVDASQVVEERSASRIQHEQPAVSNADAVKLQALASASEEAAAAAAAAATAARKTEPTVPVAKEESPPPPDTRNLPTTSTRSLLPRVIEDTNQTPLKARPSPTPPPLQQQQQLQQHLPPLALATSAAPETPSKAPAAAAAAAPPPPTIAAADPPMDSRLYSGVPPSGSSVVGMVPYPPQAPPTFGPVLQPAAAPAPPGTATTNPPMASSVQSSNGSRSRGKNPIQMDNFVMVKPSPGEKQGRRRRTTGQRTRTNANSDFKHSDYSTPQTEMATKLQQPDASLDNRTMNFGKALDRAFIFKNTDQTQNPPPNVKNVNSSHGDTSSNDNGASGGGGRRRASRPGPRPVYGDSNVGADAVTKESSNVWSPFNNTMGPPTYTPRYVKGAELLRKNSSSNSPNPSPTSAGGSGPGPSLLPATSAHDPKKAAKSPDNVQPPETSAALATNETPKQRPSLPQLAPARAPGSSVNPPRSILHEHHQQPSSTSRNASIATENDGGFEPITTATTTMAETSTAHIKEPSSSTATPSYPPPFLQPGQSHSQQAGPSTWSPFPSHHYSAYNPSYYYPSNLQHGAHTTAAAPPPLPPPHHHSHYSFPHSAAPTPQPPLRSHSPPGASGGIGGDATGYARSPQFSSVVQQQHRDSHYLSGAPPPRYGPPSFPMGPSYTPPPWPQHQSPNLAPPQMPRKLSGSGSPKSNARNTPLPPPQNSSSVAPTAPPASTAATMVGRSPPPANLSGGSGNRAMSIQEMQSFPGQSSHKPLLPATMDPSRRMSLSSVTPHPQPAVAAVPPSNQRSSQSHHHLAPPLPLTPTGSAGLSPNQLPPPSHHNQPPPHWTSGPASHMHPPSGYALPPYHHLSQHPPLPPLTPHHHQSHRAPYTLPPPPPPSQPHPSAQSSSTTNRQRRRSSGNTNSSGNTVATKSMVAADDGGDSGHASSEQQQQQQQTKPKSGQQEFRFKSYERSA